jgi:hypothetical protein
MRNFIEPKFIEAKSVEPWSARVLGLLRAASSVLLPGQGTGIVCSLLILAAVIQTGSYSILMPASVMTLLQRGSAPFRSAGLSEPKRRPPNGGIQAVAFQAEAQ